MKYYFISYSYRKGDTLLIANDLIDKHPLAWQKQVTQEFEDEEKLISWQEITKDEYDEFNGWIG